MILCICFLSSPNLPASNEIIGLNLFPPALIKYCDIEERYSLSELETLINLCSNFSKFSHKSSNGIIFCISLLSIVKEYVKCINTCNFHLSVKTNSY